MKILNAEELMNITYTDRISTENTAQDANDNNLQPVDIEPPVDRVVIEDYRGASSDLPAEINELPNINYHLDEDGDVVMDDSETIFHNYLRDSAQQKKRS